MSTNGGIFARISPLSERISAIVTRLVEEGKGREGKGRLDPSREAWRSRVRNTLRGRKERRREMKETEREREAALPGMSGILRDSWRRYNFSSFLEILSFSTISSRHIPFRQCQ